MHSLRLAALLVGLLTVLPTASVAQLAATPQAPQPRAGPDYALPPGLLISLDCPAEVRLLLQDPEGLSSPTGGRFADLELTGIEGDVSLEGVVLGRSDPAMPLHVLLKTSAAGETVLTHCVPGATARVSFLDVPIVETLDLPTRVISASFTRPGLRAIGMDNLFEVYVVAPAAGNLTFQFTADGAPLPSTLQALGEHTNASTAPWERSIGRLGGQPVGEALKEEFLGALLRLALACGAAPPELPGGLPALLPWTVGYANRRPEVCAGGGLDALLTRYDVPAPAARDLAHRLASDARCTVPANLDALDAGLDWTPLHPLPCLRLVEEWLDASLAAEGFPPVGDVEDRWSTALGLRANLSDVTLRDLTSGSVSRFFGSPCGDAPAPNVSAVANRTLPSRQLECAELVVASLRPLRTMWQSLGVIERMSSLDFGASAFLIPSSGAGQGKLTVASQGPVVVDLTIDFQFPRTVGDVAVPVRGLAREALDGLGVEPPKEPAVVARLEQLPLDLSALSEAAELATDAGTEAVARTISPALEELEQRLTQPACSINLAAPTTAATCVPTPLPQVPLASPAALGLSKVWEIAPVGALPSAASLTYGAADPQGALRAFLAPPGAALAFEPRAGGPAEVPVGEHHASVFVPHKLDARFGPPASLMTPPDAETLASLIPQGATDAASTLDGFASARLDDLLDVLAARGMPRVDRTGDVPVELLLTGTTFHVTYERGFANATREGTTYRLLNLREGLAREDLDLDGVLDRVEAALTLNVGPLPLGALPDASLAMDPLNPDSDSDGMPDGYELLQCVDGDDLDAACRQGLSPWVPDASLDPDLDMLSSGAEFARTAAAFQGSACFATLRWACLADAVANALHDPCEGSLVLLAWSREGRQAGSRDGDCDGFEDGWEATMGFDPLSPSVPDPDGDPDADGWTNLAEHAFFQSNLAAYRAQFDASRAQALAAVASSGPFGALLRTDAADTDGDGLPDGFEAARGLWKDGDEAFIRPDPAFLPRRLGPLQADSDADPDGDGVTNRAEFRFASRRLSELHPDLALPELLQQMDATGLNPFARDSDKDGLPDGEELVGFEQGLICRDPVVPSLDCDKDGLEDKVERWLAGVPQEIEADQWAQQNYPCWVRPEALTDKLAIAWEVGDSDADGIADGYECWFALDPSLASDAGLDQDGDGLTSRKEFNVTLALTPDRRDEVGFFRPAPGGEGRALIPSELAYGGRALDHDGDEVPDTYEVAVGLDPFAPDTMDTDNDGIPTPDEFTLEDQGGNSSRSRFWADLAAGIRDDPLLAYAAEYRLDPGDLDSDGDGLPDGWEHHFRLDPFGGGDGAADPDGDGATSADEYRFAFERHREGVVAEGVDYLWAEPLRSPDPLNASTDGDGMPDGFELRYAAEQGCAPADNYTSGSAGTGWIHCFDPLDARDAPGDFDGEGLTNLQEAVAWPVRIVQLKEHDPEKGDRTIVTEFRAAPNPLLADTSGDGLSDLEKVPRLLPGCTGEPSGLDPASEDTDGDGVTDLVEVWQWTAVQGLPFDIDGDCFPNGADSDSDGDSYYWGDESLLDLRDGPELDLKLTEATRGDSDGDFIPDGRELFQWRSAGYNPANLSTDFDGDELLPLRDPDSDVDLIPDGYEFQTGLDPSEWHNETHDSDGEGLSDLCEWRIQGGGNLSVCPEVLPGPSDAGPRDASSPASCKSCPGAASFFTFPLPCTHARDQDCDGDGIDDNFEYTHQNTPGCDVGVWSYHAADGRFDECLDAYIKEVVDLDQSSYRKALLKDVNSPRIRHVVLSINPAFDEQSTAEAACFYHRACRVDLRFGANTHLSADIGIEDPDCDLDKVDVSLKPPYHALTGRPDFSQRADDSQRAACQEALRQGLPYVYTFRPVLSSVAMSAHFSTLEFGGSVRLSIFASDEENNVAVSFGEDQSISGKGYRFLDQVNLALEQHRAALNGYTAKQVLGHAGAYLQYLVNRAATGGSDIEMGLARTRTADGIHRFDQALRWFDTGYEDALYLCGAPEGARGPAVAACPAVRAQLEKAISGRVRVIAGSAAAGDLLRPVADALAFGTEALFQAGTKQSDVQKIVYADFGPAFGLDTSKHGGQAFWDWFAPNYLSPGTASPCTRTNSLVAAARSANREGPGVRLEAVLRFEEALGGIPGARSSLDLDCLQRALDENGLRGKPGAEVVLQGVEAINLLADFRDVGTEGVRSVGMLSIAWQVFARAMKLRNDDPTTLAWLEAGCLAVSLIGIAKSSNPILLFFSFIGTDTCAQSRTSSPPKDAQGAAGTLGLSYFYAIDTFPDTVDPRPEQERTPGTRTLVHARIMDLTGPKQRFQQYGGFGCAGAGVSFDPTAFYKLDGAYSLPQIGFNILVERLDGGSWTHEASARFFGSIKEFDFLDDNDYLFGIAGGVADREEDTEWRFRLVNDGRDNTVDDHSTLEAFYFGFPAPGLRRVTITSIPGVVVTATEDIAFANPPLGQGESRKFPWDSSAIAQRVDASSEVGRAAKSPPVARSPHPNLELGHPADFGCSPSLVGRVSILRGVGADFTAKAPPPKVRIQDLRQGPGLTREFQSTVPRETGYHYYWDLGDRSTTSFATTDPDARVLWNFRPGPQLIRLTVVDGHGVVVAEGSYAFTAEPVPPQVSLRTSRIGDRLSFNGLITHEDACLSYSLKVRGDPWFTSPPCIGTFSDYRFSDERVVTRATLPVGSLAELRVTGGNLPDTVQTFAVAAQPDRNLNAGPAEGQFFGGYAELDTYRYTVPTSGAPSSLTFHLRGMGSFRWTIAGPPGFEPLRHTGPGDLVVPYALPLGGTEWNIRVESANNQGCYVLSVDTQQASATCLPAGFCIGAACESPAELGVPRDKRVFHIEGFERQPVPGWSAVSNEGSGVWHVSRFKAARGDASAHVGKAALSTPGYDPMKESDTLSLRMNLASMGAVPGQPLRLQFDEFNQVYERDTQHSRSYAVYCFGIALPFIGSAAAGTFTDRNTDGWRRVTADFSCPVSTQSIRLAFTFRSGPSSVWDVCWLLSVATGKPCPRAPGWFVDNIVIRES